MRKDLDRLMKERGLAGIVVFAQDRYSPAMYYATGQKIHVGMYFRGADGRAHLIHDPMERDQAAAVGCDLSTFPQHELNTLIDREGDPAKAFGRILGETCATLGMNGKVAVFGDVGIGYADVLLARARAANPAIAFDGGAPDLLTVARATKDPDEVEAIRRACRAAVAAVTKLHGWLGTVRKDGDGFRDGNSAPILLGDIRRLLQLEFLAHGCAETSGESIVSQGRDAGVPHNRGNDAEPLRAGAPLLIDIFPGEAGGGYHSDLTRTWCMGPAPEPLKKLYADVEAAFQAAMTTLRLGQPCRAYQEKTCEVFEQRGHATPRTNERTQEGYVHGLGHGVGLSVHEAPRLGGPPSNTATLEPGMAITIEPGLYYPEKGLGVRIEDLVLARADGTFENLTQGAPYPLEISIRG